MSGAPRLTPGVAGFAGFAAGAGLGAALADALAAALALVRAAPVPAAAVLRTSERGPRPLSTARSSAAVGRSAALGARQRCSAALTSALVAGAGIVPASTGGLAEYARTRLPYSAWSSRQ